MIVIHKSVKNQKKDILMVNVLGKQRMLCESIAKTAYFIEENTDETLKPSAINSLKSFTNEFENAHEYLCSENRLNDKSSKVDSLLKVSELYLKKITFSSIKIVENSNPKLIKQYVDNIASAEPFYLSAMDAVVNEYQKAAENKLQKLINSIYFLALIAALILIGEFIFVLKPALKQLLNKNNKLVKTNNDLAISENKIKANMLELTKLKTDLEIKENYNKAFIEQAPTAIAMLDTDMKYIAVSKRWIKDYKMDGQEIIGRSHYELFPEIGEDWKAKHQKCLNGAIDVCDEAPFTRADGTVQWIFWDVRPWYISKGNIGGLIMHTGDVTHIKEKDEEKIKIEKILDSTNEVARIGTWDVDLVKDKIFWSRMVREIHEVPKNYKPDLETAINFFKEGKSRDTIERVVKEAIEYGAPYDVEVELVTAKKNVIWTRAIGQAEIVDGKCVRIFGVFQDINDKKISELALNKAHRELQAIFNAKPIAIVTTDNNGVINHFNRGAEILTGYSASEMIGLQKPEIYHIKEELNKFRNDIANQYGKNPIGFNPLLELSKQNAYDAREWTYVRKDGSTIPVQLTLTALKNEEGEKIGFLAVSSDISKRKKAENELLRKNQLLNLAEEIALLGHWQWNRSTDKMLWSRNLYNMLEANESAENLSFKTYLSYVHPDDITIVKERHKKNNSEKVFENFTHRISTNGKVKTVKLSGKAITNDKGEILEIIGTCQDITEQKMAEKKFRGLLESAPDAMVIVNEKGKIQLVNKQAEKLFGYAAEELIEKPVEILIQKRFIGMHQGYRDTFFTSPKTRSMGQGKELYGVNKNGLEIPIQISLSPLQTEEGLLVSAAIRDITEQKLAESKIIKAKENLEVLANKLTAQNTQLADFAHITSHNLRAPVSNLNSLLDFYNESDNEEDKVKLFKKFEKVIHHLTLTLNTLVNAIKIKNETSKKSEVIMFDDVLNKTKEMLVGEILKTNAKIISDFSKINSVSYNNVYLESIFLNLVGNAIKYRDKNRSPELFIESEIENEKIKLKFKDNGLGIDLERHGHKLFGLNKVFHRHPEAKGVGLFITKMQVEAMGGTISATSKVNEGTTFYINF
ncbi:PAS domain S-box protein [Seonamhaeicola sp. NFXS20]|uniref:PAS domain-containing sensor histidine kinase n=1 Tax=Seonamhaeicola sp. NFXS20 TaxID=2816959 RepID=UPI003B8B8BD7